MNGFTFDHTGFTVDGKDAYLVSGEFHYFRVPAEDWERRMRLFAKAGGNCIATYVPWIIHEPEEGDIRFGDVPNRDLAAFLDTAAKVGLKVILRPGPYQYSEMVNGGLPVWLLERYPEIMARDKSGKAFFKFSVSYLHPVFLEKARAYFRAFADVVRPYMAENGGPVCMLQVDNEMTGVHIWFGSVDYNAESMGFGREDGRYAKWLAGKFGTVDAMNRAYGTSYGSFGSVIPSDADSKLQDRDYLTFYRASVAEYACLLKSWFIEDGLHAYICHNSANPNMNPTFLQTVKEMGEGFLLGSDHYYTLNQTWAQNNPTPQYAISILRSCDELRAMGMPPCVMELPGGSPSDTPPILTEDLMACYLTNVAFGAKGVNIYIYTGGPNFGDTGDSCDIYDYNAIIHADGRINDSYETLKTFGSFLKAHGSLQREKRVTSVQVGYEWETMDDPENEPGHVFGDQTRRELIERGILYTLMCSGYAPEMVPFTGELDLKRPLIVPCASAMNAKSQTAVIDFVKHGGNVLILPVLPETDRSGESCTLLKDFVNAAGYTARPKAGNCICVENVGNVYGIGEITAFDEQGEVLARDRVTGNVVAFEKECGGGKAILFGGSWRMETFPQAMMMEEFLKRLGAERTVTSSNRSIFTVLWRDAEGRQVVYLLNLYSGCQSTEIFLGDERKPLGRFDLQPMEVKVIEF